MSSVSITESLDRFISSPIVVMHCLPFYINKRVPTYEEFTRLLNELRHIAEQCELCTKNEQTHELYNRLISHEKIISFLN